MENYIKIGRTGKAFGTEGALKVRIEEPFLDDFLKAPVTFIQLLGKPVPFFLAHIHNDSPLIVKWEEVDSRDAALQLAGKVLFLRKEDIAEGASEQVLDLRVLEGFKIIDQTLGEIGLIKEVMELPEQLMAIVEYQEREVLIPLHDTLILSVDTDKAQLFMSLPEGLLEL